MVNKKGFGSIARDCARFLDQEEHRLMTYRWQHTGLLTAVYFTPAPLTLANGHSGGHMSGMGSNGNSSIKNIGTVHTLFRICITPVSTTRPIRLIRTCPLRNSRR